MIVRSVSRIISAAGTTNATLAKAAPGYVHHISCYNANVAARYLKLYNKKTAPTVGTDVPVMTLYLAPQAYFHLDILGGLYFPTGIGYAMTTAGADNSTAALTAADVLGLNIAFA